MARTSYNNKHNKIVFFVYPVAKTNPKIRVHNTPVYTGCNAQANW